MSIDDKMKLFWCKNSQNDLIENKIAAKRFILFACCFKMQ
jgi:hypothetical protein